MTSDYTLVQTVAAVRLLIKVNEVNQSQPLEACHGEDFGRKITPSWSGIWYARSWDSKPRGGKLVT